jgi:hypothetical protein
MENGEFMVVEPDVNFRRFISNPANNQGLQTDA